MINFNFKLKVGFASIFLSAFIALSGIAKQEKPNILFIVSEDNGYNYTSFAGDELASHPTLDKLAAQGIVFDKAYSNGAVCAVARSTMITGMYASSLGTTHMRSLYPIPEFIDTYATLFRKAGYYTSNVTKTDYNTCSISRNIWDSYKFPSNRDKGKPFIAVHNITISHESRIFPKAQKSGDKTRVSPSDVELAPFYIDTPELRQDIAFYYECISKMDKAVHAILDKLEKDGTKDDTFIIYASDHGGVLPRSKRYLEDTGTHIPLIIVTPKNWQEYALQEAGTRSDMLVSLVDMPATMLSIAGIEVPKYMQGKAIMGKYKSEEMAKYSYLYSGRYDSETYHNFRRGITDGTYRYIRDFYSFVPYALSCEYPYRQAGANSWVEEYRKGNANETQAMYFKSLNTADLLYNTSLDKWEVNNIHKEDSKKLEEMKNDLYSIMLDTKDAGIYPEAFFYDMKDGETVYDIVNGKDFNYKSILDLAWKSGDRNPQDLPVFLENLKSKDRTLRYWAIIGLANLGESATSATPALKETMQNDCEVANRVTAALALDTISKDSSAKDFLESIDKNYIKQAEAKASDNKVAFIQGYIESTHAVITDRLPIVGAMTYLKSFGLSPSFVSENPFPEIRLTGAEKKQAAKSKK